MEKVKFLSDYRGVRTNEIFFTKGSVTELANDPALELRDMGVVEIIVPKAKAKAAPKSKKK